MQSSSSASSGSASSPSDSASPSRSAPVSPSSVSSGDSPAKVTYEHVPLVPLSHPLPDLDDDDNELWLVRVPRHDALRKDLLGAEVWVGGGEDVHGVPSQGYVFRGGECDASAVDSPRAAFVVEDEAGVKAAVAKSFKRIVNISFDVPLTNLNGLPPRARSYPSVPEGQTLKYLPIGSTAITSSTVTNEKSGVASPAGGAKKRRRSDAVAAQAAETSTLSGGTPERRGNLSRLTGSPANSNGETGRASPGGERRRKRRKVKAGEIGE